MKTLHRIHQRYYDRIYKYYPEMDIKYGETFKKYLGEK